MAIGLGAFLISLAVGTLGFVSESEMDLFGTRVRFDVYGVPQLIAQSR